MKCALEGKVSHSGGNDRFKETLLFCPLLKSADKGMSRIGVICGHCEFRIGQVLDKKREMTLRGEISPEALQHNPNLFVQYLPEPLKEYGKKLPGITGLDWQEIEAECNRCPKQIVNQPTYNNADPQPTKHYYSTRDIKVYGVGCQ